VIRGLIEKQRSWSYFHQPQPVGRCFIPGQLLGYYNDLTGKTMGPGPLSDARVPLVALRNGTLVETPVSIAQLALGFHDRWLLHGARHDREQFLYFAELLARRGQVSTLGVVWTHEFDFASYRLERPWISAMAQGQAVSTLTRAYRLTNDAEFLRLAQAGARPLMVAVDEGGVGRATEDGWWLEEYPSRSPSRVLNGCIFALWGLYDLGLCGDRSAMELFQSGRDTVAHALPKFALAGWSRYDLYPRGLPNLASPYYHRLHVAQLDAMWQLTGIRVFARFRDRWQAAAASRMRVLTATAYKGAWHLTKRVSERLSSSATTA
jgi:heparosan-N-sulfate-glucuronate 5-epimerase